MKKKKNVEEGEYISSDSSEVKTSKKKSGKRKSSKEKNGSKPFKIIIDNEKSSRKFVFKFRQRIEHQR